MAFITRIPVTPAAEPTSKPAEFSAFRGGGGLTGAAEPIAPPPMQVRWTYKTDDAGSVENAVAITSDTVYVADEKGTLAALELASGKERWKFKCDGGFATAPLVMDGKVFIGDLDGLLHCVWAADGKELWKFDAEGPIHSSANAANGRIVFGNDNGQITCLNAADRTKAWSAPAGDRVNSAPAIANGVALFSGCDAHLRGINLADGKEAIDVDLEALSGGSPAVLADRIVVGTDRGRVVCFSADGKQRLWAFEKIEAEAMVYASVAAVDGVVVAGARDKRVYGLDLATGNKLWDFATRGEVDSSPLVSDGRVYVGSKDKNLYVLDLKTGQELWKFPAGRSITAPPAIGHGVLVIGDNRGNVYCLEK